MHVLIVHCRVKPEHVAAFRAATLENARASLQEPGVARFDFLQQTDDPTRFVLFEVYRNADAPAQHKATAHYQKWVEVTAPMFAEPRTRALYTEVFWSG
ncbi:MAG: antibiotic biosynthesis monooxygenase [Verrucomicrobiae bacterium]|nr:antibiotic biosynthesis monooxygenase [Verrucomicrobiae bacterium]